MASYKLTAILHKDLGEEQVTANFTKREFIMKVPGAYVQHVKFQLVQDRTVLLDQFTPGEEIVVHFDLRGREYNGNWFTNLQAWKIEPSEGPTEGTGEDLGKSGTNIPQSHGSAKAALLDGLPDDTTEQEDDDDLPF